MGALASHIRDTHTAIQDTALARAFLFPSFLHTFSSSRERKAINGSRKSNKNKENENLTLKSQIVK